MSTPTEVFFELMESDLSEESKTRIITDIERHGVNIATV